MASLATMVVLTVLAVVIWSPGGAAAIEPAEVSRRLAAEASRIAADQPALARRLAVAAYRTAPTPQARASVLTLFTSSSQPLPAGVLGSAAPAFSPDGKLMASSDLGPDSVVSVQLWDTTAPARDSEPLARFSIPGDIVDLAVRDTHPEEVRQALAFSPDGKMLAAARSNNSIQLWDVTSRGDITQPLATFTGSDDGVFGILFSPDGNRLATSGPTALDATAVNIRIWDATARGDVTGPLAIFSGPDVGTTMVFGPDGKVLAAGGKTVQLWDVTARRDVTQPLATLSGPGVPVELQFSPDGSLLAAGGFDNTISVWDAAARGQEILPVSTFAGPTRPTNRVGVSGYLRFSPDGKLLATGITDNTIQVWDATIRGKVTQPLSIFIGHTRFITDIDFSSDGTLLATSSEDGTSRVWDSTARGTVTQPLATLIVDIGQVSKVTFSQDDRLLAVGGGAGQDVWYWDLNIERLVEKACAETANWLSEAEWKAVVADAAYDPPCS